MAIKLPRAAWAVRAAGAFRAASPPLLVAAGALGLTALGGHLTIKAHQAAEERRNGRDIRILNSCSRIQTPENTITL